VFQEALLFNRSIADNLRRGNVKCHRGSDAGRRPDARRHWTSSRENFAGLKDQVGPERGRSFRAAKRQRLSDSAPALLKDLRRSQSLDEGNQRRLMRHRDQGDARAHEVMKNRTTSSSLTRLSTVRKASRILVFDAGAESSRSVPFDELVAAGGALCRSGRAGIKSPAAIH